MQKLINKTITIISLNYAPEDTAIGLYSTQMAEFLVSKGWNVIVITGFPYYPQWKISEAYKSKNKYFAENINGVNIFRYKQYVPSHPTFIKRIFHIIDFTLGTIFNLKKIKESNIVLSVIPFTSSAWLGNKLAKRLNAKHWIHIQDFEFDAAFESGLATNNGINNILSNRLFRLEKHILNKAYIISTISNGMLDKLSQKSSADRYYFPNWIDNRSINPIEANKHEYLKSDKFKVLYSGNIGAKQDWNFFLEVVDYFKNDDNIEFVVVGNGATKEDLISNTKLNNNVIHFNPIPFSELNDLLCSADLHILFQKPDVVDTVMPSKILGMMASSKPSIVTGNISSEVSRVFEYSNGGEFIEALNIDEVISAIKKYQENIQLCINTGKCAREYVISKFSIKEVLEHFSKKLETII